MTKETKIPTLVPPMSPEDTNRALWDAVATTDPAYTKAFKRAGGFAGTAINPTYLIRRATERWGPMGDRWGVQLLTCNFQKGEPVLNSREEVIGHVKICVVVVGITYPTAEGKAGPVIGIGQTEYVGRRKSGEWFTDEEAPKKSYTDALTKALSHLGFAADVHLGLYDDNKYVNDLRTRSPGKVADARGPAGKDNGAGEGPSVEDVRGLAALATTTADLLALAGFFHRLDPIGQAMVRDACAAARKRVEG